MTITVVSTNSETIIADVDGVRSTIPRSMKNGDYQRLYSLGMKALALENGVYNAFPSSVMKKGSSLVFIFSSGDGHASSQWQIMMRSDNDGETFTSGVYFTAEGQVFNNALLDGFLATGEVFSGKNILTARKTSGGYDNKPITQVVVSGQGGNDGTYNLWSSMPLAEGGKLYCTGYRTSGPYTVTACFVSIDSGWSYSLKSIMASNASLAFSEAAIIKTAAGDFLSVIREDTGAGRPLYVSRSNDLVTWSAPTKMSPMQGTQPALLRLPDDSILLVVGHRVGASGLDVAGRMIIENNSVTGIACWRSTNSGSTWSERVMLSPMWSTDGGQPMPLLLSSGLVGLPCYLAPAQTGGDAGVEPGIYWITFKGEAII